MSTYPVLYGEKPVSKMTAQEVKDEYARIAVDRAKIRKRRDALYLQREKCLAMAALSIFSPFIIMLGVAIMGCLTQ